MSQNDFTIANQTFPNTRADINAALQALASNSSGSSTPSTTYANQFFYNTTSNLLQMLNEDNDGLITICELDQTADNVEYFKSTAIRLARIEFEDGDDALTIADGGGVSVHTSLNFPDNIKALFGAGSDLQVYHDGSNSYIVDSATGNLAIQSSGAEVQISKGPSGFEHMIRAIVDGAVELYHNGVKQFETISDGVKITGATTETKSLEVGTGRSGDGTSLIDLVGDATYGDFGARLIRNSGANGASELIHRGTGQLALTTQDAGLIAFKTSNAEKVRIDTSGNMMIGTTNTNPTNSNVVGTALRDSGIIICNGNASQSAIFGRTNDGSIVLFTSAGSQEGSISVSGTTVSYNGGHLSRWGRLPDDSKPTILKGTVMSNLDAMIVWDYPDELYTEEDKTEDQIPEGKSVGDVKKPAYTANNEQRNQIKISDAEGDINVAGLFTKWDDEIDGFHDIDLAMTGDMVIRIAKGTTVQRGDLLMSAGDGTAKPQGDDIVRSKTIAKVTSTTVINTYADDSFVVPCVVMAC